jgi:hypothetical protein
MNILRANLRVIWEAGGPVRRGGNTGRESADGSLTEAKLVKKEKARTSLALFELDEF